MLIDSHCHLDLEQFDEDRDQVVQRAQAAGVRLIVNPGIDLANAPRVIELAERYAGVFAAVGIHPNSAAGFTQDAIPALRALAAHPRVVAIGEIGLDNYWDIVTPAQQQEALQAQLALAAEVGKPVIIHSRDANTEVAEMLRAWVGSSAFRASPLAQREFAGVLHAFSGDLALAQEAYDWGFALSLGGPVTFKRAHNLHALLPHLRLDRLMLETDAPYLTPHPWRGKRNEPAHVAHICSHIAKLCDMRAEDVAQTTTAVAVRFFSLEDAFRAFDSNSTIATGSAAVQ